MPEKQVKKTGIWAAGLALFSMFFGAGNLIFPLAVGSYAKDLWSVGAWGFLVTAVLVPFCGVLAVVLYEGNYKEFFSAFGSKVGFFLSLCILVFWIPLGSAPRNIALAHASFVSFMPTLPLWFFGLIYSACVFLANYFRSRVVDIVGLFLTPLLLACLALLFWQGWSQWQGFDVSTLAPTSTFTQGLFDGYFTMDLLSAFFFSSTLIQILKEQESSKATQSGLSLLITLRAGVIGVSLLAAVYFGLIFVAASNAALLEGVAKESLWAFLTQRLLGGRLGIVAALTVALACFSTSIVLVTVFSDFLRESLCRGKLNHTASLALSCALIYGFSTLGYSRTAAISGPAFEVLYPVLMVMMAILLPLRYLQRRRARVVKVPEAVL